MNIFRPQLPYVFRPAKFSLWLSPLLMALSKRFYLRGMFKVCDVHVDGHEAVAQCIQDGHAVLIAPNHADHADPHVMLQAGRRCRSHFHFMAAREGFEESPVNRFILQRMGAFSVDREGADLSAIKQAIQLLSDADYPLVIFPEGEIWHHHETLDEINEGVASILIKAFRRLEDHKDAFLVPTALRYFYEPDIETTFDQRLSRLETSINWAPRSGQPLVERITRLCTGLLATKEIEFLGRNLQGSVLERLAAFQSELVQQVETDLSLEPNDEDRIPARVKRARHRIRKDLTEGGVTDEVTAAHYRLLDRLYLAVQLYSYPGQYLVQEPSVDRIAETLLKLEEDVLGKGTYPSCRRVDVRFGAPISIRSFLETRSLTAKTAVGPLTETLAGQIQELLDRNSQAIVE